MITKITYKCKTRKKKSSWFKFKINKENKKFSIPNYEFIDEKITINEIDYYHSNVVARASKTMTECKNLRSNFKKTGTEG